MKPSKKKLVALGETATAGRLYALGVPELAFHSSFPLYEWAELAFSVILGFE